MWVEDEESSESENNSEEFGKFSLEEEEEYEYRGEEQAVFREKRAASTTNNYIHVSSSSLYLELKSQKQSPIRSNLFQSLVHIALKVWVEIQFSKKRPQLGMTMTNFSANIDRLIFAMNGTFGEKVLKPKVGNPPSG